MIESSQTDKAAVADVAMEIEAGIAKCRNSLKESFPDRAEP